MFIFFRIVYWWSFSAAVEGLRSTGLPCLVFFSNLHPKLETEAFLGTKGQEAGDATSCFDQIFFCAASRLAHTYF